LVVVASLVSACVAACGGQERPPDPRDAVRRAATEYVRALREQRWDDACERMTKAAQRAVAAERRSCAGALADGGALAPDTLAVVARQLPGARVRIAGAAATLGPVGDLPEPLRFEHRGSRWLVAP
jgi:hypothetical protein